MIYVSCAPEIIYRSGGFFEPPSRLMALMDEAVSPHTECEVIREVFPPYRYDRPAPAALTADPGFLDHLNDSNASLNRVFAAGPAAVLVGLVNAYVYANVVYTSSTMGFRAVYETHRPCDRPHPPVIDWLAAQSGRRELSEPNTVDVYLGSVGTSNYGHWLVDDLPRGSAIPILLERASGRKLRVWIASAGDRMDAVRADSLSTLFGHFGPFEVIAYDPSTVCHFDNLYYVTPSSYHPTLKSPEALRSIASPFHTTVTGNRPQRILVSRRRDRGRSLANFDTVRQMLLTRGFVEIDTEDMSFVEQAETFAAASVVVGCMGAAMTNCLFCRPDTTLIYLAPVGWIEPFYWDLAAVLNHRYAVCFGPLLEAGKAPHLSAYEIEPSELHDMLVTLEV